MDVSHTAQGASVVGHCFRLRVDAGTQYYNPTHIELRRGGALDIYGRVYFMNVPGAFSSGQINLPKGSRIIVERVLSWRNVETSSLKPYIQIDGALIDADGLFRPTEEGLTYVDRLLEPCDAN
ncbi:hypothetical protein GCM10009105_10160 [Dokdonella soli]|uniref:Uncharacterized protein n=1 Tax=Dokdonella soli TaxID=529810 RepID=A0ABN1IE06_9GAMM